MELIKELQKLKNSPVSEKVNNRIKEFNEKHTKDNDEWFSELCFCILTANSQAQKAINIQNELHTKGFIDYPSEKIKQVIRKNQHRFHNNKTKYIIEARNFKNIKDILSEQDNKREWLVKNIKGLGEKESSHFLRNVGFHDYAILDRHIINLLSESNFLKEKPKTLTPKKYNEIEKEFKELSKKLDLNLSQLDLYMWYLKTGEILK